MSETLDGPLAVNGVDMSKCPRCDVPMTFGDNHAGRTVARTNSNGYPLEFAHVACVGGEK